MLALGLVAATGISALPSPGSSDPKTPACLLSGQVYNGADKECQCPPGQEAKPNRGKCGYPAYPPPKCGHEGKPYCAKGKKEYCGYGA
jgi:hypothetical protein